MDSIRISRIQSLMKDELSVLINRQLKDPRVPTVVVTDVELTRDGKQATVKISILSLTKTHADPAVMSGCLDALNHAKGWLKRQLSSIMSLRAMPDLIFKEDKGLENTLRVNEILKQLSAEKKPDENTTAGAATNAASATAVGAAVGAAVSKTAVTEEIPAKE